MIVDGVSQSINHRGPRGTLQAKQGSYMQDRSIKWVALALIVASVFVWNGLNNLGEDIRCAALVDKLTLRQLVVSGTAPEAPEISRLIEQVRAAERILRFPKGGCLMFSKAAK